MSKRTKINNYNKDTNYDKEYSKVWARLKTMIKQKTLYLNVLFTAGRSKRGF